MSFIIDFRVKLFIHRHALNASDEPSSTPGDTEGKWWKGIHKNGEFSFSEYLTME
jgi:hypothetical protein